DPGVFTELIQTIGVKGAQVEELYALDYESLASLKPVFGLIFLFKWRAEKDERPVVENPPETLFFARQKINNACATQAILSILMNARDHIELGDELSQFYEFTKTFSADMRGDTIGNSEVMRTAHNSFARPDPFVMEEDKSRDDKDDEAFHFISYVPSKGTLYELDGLKKGPIIIGHYNENEDWLQKVVPIIQERVARYSQTEIKFNLLAVMGDQKIKYEKEIEELTKQDISDPTLIAQREDRLADLRECLNQQVELRAKWKEENIKRRHNYVPFLVNLIKVLAQKNELMPLIESAKNKL
ncbi:ubiquitin carboxyl-terminal hydrolase, partial [Acrasis kona]